MDIFHEALFSLCPVEKDMGDVWMFAKKGMKIIRADGIFNDICIKAARACARLHDIPEGDVVLAKELASFKIGQVCGNLHEGAYYFPKSIAWVRIVLLSIKGGLSRHASENEYFRI